MSKLVLQDKLHQKVSNPIDNWKSLPYECRVQDALADLFWVFSPCSSVVVNDYTVYWSLNSFPSGHTKIKCDFFLSMLQKHIGSPLNLMSFRLLSNQQFIEFVKNQVRADKSSIKLVVSGEDSFLKTRIKILESFIKEYNKTKLLLNSFDSEEVFLKKELELQNVFDGVRELYLQILEKCYFDESKGAYVGSFLRPLQDCYKISCWFHNRKLNLVKVENNKEKSVDDEIHAENNLFHHFDQNKEIYYGTSKLSCGYCHEQLGVKNLNHRGSHGVLNKWGTKNSFDKDLKELVFKNAISPKEKQTFDQTRELSDDEDFEKNISVLGVSQEKKVSNFNEFKMSIFQNQISRVFSSDTQYSYISTGHSPYIDQFTGGIIIPEDFTITVIGENS